MTDSDDDDEAATERGAEILTRGHALGTQLLHFLAGRKLETGDVIAGIGFVFAWALFSMPTSERRRDGINMLTMVTNSYQQYFAETDPKEDETAQAPSGTETIQ